jgi:hypothetical protein
MKRPTLSGRVTCTTEGVRYEWRGGAWSLVFDEIVVIGECTNELGPFADDYYICFVRGDGARWLSASFYAEGRDELLECLAHRFGTTFEYSLCDSTTFRSRVMWPPQLRNLPLFEYHEPEPINRIGRWLRRIGLKPMTNVQVVSEEVRRFASRTGV